MTKKKARGAYKCGNCGEDGHNARKCPKKTTETKTPSRSQKKKKAAKVAKKVAKKVTKKAPAKKAEKPVKAAPELTDVFSEDTPGLTPEPEKTDNSAPLPGAKVVIPRIKRKRTKAEEAFWAKSDEKLAPNCVADASELSLQIPRISTGNFAIDVACYGGLPQGRIIRFWGQPKSAKTGSCLNTAASYQLNHCSECFATKCDCKLRDVPDVLWIDAENRMNSMLYWPQGHGINLERFRVVTPPSGQNVVDYVDHVIREAKAGLIVVDSLANIVSQDELKKATLDGVTVGRNAHLLNSAWRKWNASLNGLGIHNAHKPTVLCINQIREKVGVNFGSPETMPGGKGQEFASSFDVRFSKGSPSYIVYDMKKDKWVAKQKGFKSTFKPAPDATPDFLTVNYRVTASGICPSGRYGEFNYWLKNAHGHRIGDPDNGLQLWQYCKRYDLIQQEGGQKHLFGHSARTLDELQTLFRADPKAHKKAWKILMDKLVAV